MKRLEIIHLRLAGPRPPGLVEEIRESIESQSGLVSIRIYRHAAVATDVGIHLHLEADADDSRVTELGVRLASALREYGMVEHTVWIEEEIA